MNQILITEKLYITPELKRKKRFYRMNFFLSVFLVCVLFSYYIYAEYDRNKNEEVSKEILANLSLEEEQELESSTRIRLEDNVLVVMLNEEGTQGEEIDLSELTESDQSEQTVETLRTESGETYSIDSILNIPKLGINYPVISKTTEELLKISLTKFWGHGPNEVGNYVVVGHNYKNKKMFGRLSEIKLGDIIQITDMKGNTVDYEVYDRYVVAPDNTACTSQETDGKREITLITCTNYGTQRLIVKAQEV